jgi:glycosyltransferase involved in cell wall biosynthesis
MWRKLHVIHMGIPIEQFNKDDADPMNQGVDPTILFIGRQVPEKGEGVLLEAVALLLERSVEVQVTVAGDGDARPDFEQLADRLCIASHVSFPGPVGQDDIRSLYAAASIFCLPSFAEGVPCVLMEAMAMETPVVSTPIAGIPELIDNGHTGLLVTPGRADLLAEALERLLADPELRQTMGSVAREKVIRDFNNESCAAQLHALFAAELAPEAAQRQESIPTMA